MGGFGMPTLSVVRRLRANGRSSRHTLRGVHYSLDAGIVPASMAAICSASSLE